MNSKSLTIEKKNLTLRPSGKWVLRKKIDGKELSRVLDNTGGTAGDPPLSVKTEANHKLALYVSNMGKKIEAKKKRKASVATIGEILDAFSAWPLVKALAKRTRSGYVNALYNIISVVHLPQYANLSGSRNTGNGTSKVELRNAAINKLSSNILTSDLINSWIAFRMDRGPVYRKHEVVPEKESGELTKKELRRVLLSIRTCSTKARSLFAKNARATGDIMCPTKGAYRDLKLPDTLDNFLGMKTTKPGRTKYKAPKAEEILGLISGLPELHQTHPEAYKAFKIAYGTGLRIDEIRKLKWDDISDQYKITLEETKNGDERINECLGESTFKELWDMKSDPVFVIGGGSHYRKWRLGGDISQYFRSKGWHRNQCLHELRKYFGCLLARNKKDLTVVMRALGHANISTTQHYYNDEIEEFKNPDFAASLPLPGLEKAA